MQPPRKCLVNEQHLPQLADQQSSSTPVPTSEVPVFSLPSTGVGRNAWMIDHCPNDSEFCWLYPELDEAATRRVEES